MSVKGGRRASPSLALFEETLNEEKDLADAGGAALRNTDHCIRN